MLVVLVQVPKVENQPESMKQNPIKKVWREILKKLGSFQIIFLKIFLLLRLDEIVAFIEEDSVLNTTVILPKSKLRNKN